MLTERVLRSLRALLPRGQVFTDQATLIAYEADAGLDRGRPEAVVFPRTLGEIVRVVRWAAEQQVPLIARGAGTGLSGGAIADRGGIILEFVHFSAIQDFDLMGRNIVVEPALINLRLDERARMDGLYFPPDPSSQRASTIGGNVAENSGGPHCFKYGVTTNYISGMQVVLADGRAIRIGGRVLDYPEYDLCGLVTGSEGTLALITSITARLVRNPPAVKTLLAIFDSVEVAGAAVSAVIAAGLVPATMEMMDQRIVRIIEPFAHAGLPLDAGAVLIIELDGYPASLDAQANEIMQILEKHNGRDMRVARDEEERYKIWLARKSAAGGIAREAPAYHTIDITVPRSSLVPMLEEVNRICDRYRVRAGHVFHAGDGNLHPLVLIPDPDDPELLERIHRAGREMVLRSVEMNGSLTGEHGVGVEKRQYMLLMHNAAELLAMWDVKQAFDPAGILNPGKVFPRPEDGERGPYAGYAPHRWQDVAPTAPLPDDVFAPETADEAARGLAALTREGRAVMIGSVREKAGETRLSTEKLCGVLKYAPDDLYITVGAGMLLVDIQQFLARENKQLALVSPWPATTVGGLVAANLNAPLRMRYGAVREQVLCATVALADGRVIRTGRPIVKNVAGYDLTKVFVGSYGTLGLLADVSLKIVVRPRACRTLLIPLDDLSQGLHWGQQLLTVALNASAIVLCQGHQAEGLPASRYVLAYTAEGVREDVEAELTQVRELLRGLDAPETHESTRITGNDIWSQVLACQDRAALLARAAVPAKDLPRYVREQAGALAEQPWVADIASGQIYATRLLTDAEEMGDWLNALRAPALALGGYALVMDLPETESSLANGLDRWGYQPEGLAIMQRLKARWDPRGILNPGVFVVGK